MEETSHTKKLEVAQHYLLGDTYRQIEEETGVSHGSIANIIRGFDSAYLLNIIMPRNCGFVREYWI